MNSPFSVNVTPDGEAFVRCIQRQGTSARVHFIELFLDREIQDAICERYGVLEGIQPTDPFYEQKRHVAIQSFLGYDFAGCTVEGIEIPIKGIIAEDTAGLPRQGGRRFLDEHVGPITNWDEFEAFPWPDPLAATTRWLEWYQENLPENMCVIAVGGYGHYAEFLAWLMGYETLCIALCEQRDLVAAMANRLTTMFRAFLEKTLRFDKVKVIWASDDMGFRGATLISPDDLRQFVLPGHKILAEMAHASGRPYILHSCGNLSLIMEDLIEDVRIDGKHSFEDAIEEVTVAKRKYGDRIALLGGIDLDFLCRATEAQVRRRVRETLDICMPGGGYCLGTGNSVANYVPLDNYLAMLDEGRRFSG